MKLDFGISFEHYKEGKTQHSSVLSCREKKSSQQIVNLSVNDFVSWY